MRRKARQERRGGDSGGAVRYQMREKMVSIGDDYWIEDAHGQKVFKVDGKALRVRDTLLFKDRQGNDLCKVQEKKYFSKNIENCGLILEEVHRHMPYFIKMVASVAVSYVV